IEQRAAEIVGNNGGRIADREHIAPERLARKEHAARQSEGGIELALEGGLEAGDIDAQTFQQTLGDVAVERLRGLHRLAAAVADEQVLIEAEFVALGMAAEVVEIVQDQDTRARVGAPVNTGRGETLMPPPTTTRS